MATLKFIHFKARVLKDGRNKIRIAVCHKQGIYYIVTRFIIDHLSQSKNIQGVKCPDAIRQKQSPFIKLMINSWKNRHDSISLEGKLVLFMVFDLRVNE